MYCIYKKIALITFENKLVLDSGIQIFIERPGQVYSAKKMLLLSSIVIKGLQVPRNVYK